MSDEEYYQKILILLLQVKKGAKKAPQPHRTRLQNEIQSLIQATNERKIDNA